MRYHGQLSPFEITLSPGLWRLLLALVSLISSQWGVAGVDVLIVESHDSSPYQQMVSGLKAGLADRSMQLEFTTQLLNGAGTEDMAEIVRQQSPKLMVTLGTPATRTVLNQERSVPVVAGLLLDDEELRRHRNATGISLAFPAISHWQWLRRLLPAARRIAVIYDPQHGDELFQALKRAAQAENVELIPAPAQAAEDLSALMSQWPSQLDALWALDGVAVFNPVTVRELLLYSFRNRTPLIGLSEQWVKAGAIYALDWDYVDLGHQVAELVWAIIANRTELSALPVQMPRKIRPVFNSKTAEHMKITIPERWLSEMSEVMP